MNHPEVVIIYVPSDGQAHCIGAGRKGGKWLYSKLTYIPVSGLNQFIREELVSRGMIVFDVRKAAKQLIPGMEDATPIIVHQKHVPLKIAIQAFEQLHRAILESEEQS